MTHALASRLAGAGILAASLLFTLEAAAQYGGPTGPVTSVRGAAVGSEVVVSMSSGLAPGARISLNFGGLSGGYEILGRAEADASGAFQTTLIVPTWAQRNEVYFVFANVGGGVRLFSDPFIVTGPLGAVQVSGTVTEVADGCVLIAGLDETRYTLFNVTTPVAVGARVRVDGTVSNLDRVVPEGSSCAGRPAIPVRVETIRVG
jgi:hypothetical protein